MGFYMKLCEVVSNKGTYAGVRFSSDTKKAITQYIEENNIPNGIAPSKMHTTLLYSRKFLPNYEALGKYQPHLVGIPSGFDVWKSNNEDGSSTNCLVVKYDCPELNKRHKELMTEHGATFDYPTYQTHITLSYDIGDMDINELPEFRDTVPEIEIASEYKEMLDLSWAENKGTKKD